MLTALPLIAAVAYAGYSAARFARAEWLSQRDTVESLQQALRLTPENASYYARVAALDPTRQADLDTALRHNPRDPSWWILRSVREEEDGDVSAAEESLLRANHVARYYVPRWSLAAFYFRHENRAKFAAAARDALSLGYGDSDSLFRMAQRLGFTSDEILGTILPGDPVKLEAYLRLVLQDGDVDAADRVAMKLLAVGSAEQFRATLLAADALFFSGRIERSVQLWNKVAEAGWIPLPRLDPSAGVSLAVESFGRETLGHGFDWRYTNVAGVSWSQDETGLRLDFSGKQPERCDLVSQRIVPGLGRRYRLTVRYRVDGIGYRTGLAVLVRPLSGGSSVMNGMLTSGSSDWRDESFEFEAPREPIPLEIALVYARSVGTTRIEGRLWVQSVKLRPAA